MRFVQRYFTDGELAVFRQYRLTGRFAACHFLAVGIPEDVAEAVVLRLQAGVFNSGLYRQLGLVKGAASVLCTKVPKGATCNGAVLFSHTWR